MEEQFEEAIKTGAEQSVRKFIEEGFDVNYKQGKAARVAAGEGQAGILDILIEHGVDFKAKGNMALGVASVNGQSNAVEILVKHGANVNDYDDFALRMAVEEGHLECVRILLCHGADPGAREFTAVRKAAGFDDKGIFNLLLDNLSEKREKLYLDDNEPENRKRVKISVD